MNELQNKIESILFVAGRPVKIGELEKTLGLGKTELLAVLQKIKTEWQNRGINLIEKDNKYQFVTAPQNGDIVGDFLNAELREKLTDAAIETLAIILYKQPVTRVEIESIRGVNSQYILRQLSIRGLVEKHSSSEDGRRLVYKTTLEFMKHMGITDLKQLPDFDELTKNVSLEQQDLTLTRQKSSELPQSNIPLDETGEPGSQDDKNLEKN